MTSASAPVKAGFSRVGVEELSWAKGEPDWLRERRLAAWEVFEETPWPTGKEEEWKRIDISGFRLEEYSPFSDPGYRASALADLPVALRNAVGDGADGVLVQHDSATVARFAAESLGVEGVVFMSLDDAVRLHPDLVREHLGSVVKPEDGKFAALNAAFWSGGTFVYVPKGVESSLPLRTLHWSSVAGSSIFNRTLVVVEEQAAATLIDDYVSDGDIRAFDAGGVELVVRAGAKLRYVSLQDWGPSVTSFNFVRGQTGRDGTINWLIVALGASVSKSNVEAMILEPGSNHEMLGLVFGDRNQQFDHHTLQDHQAGHSTSDLLFKGVLKDSARSIFSGLIRVAPGAQRTDSYQANRNLLLSDRARADSVPTLEIEANDVRCTHGATVGPIDPEQVFYLQARAIPRPEAEQMIVQGFLEPLLARIPLENVRQRLDEVIARKMA